MRMHMQYENTMIAHVLKDDLTGKLATQEDTSSKATESYARLADILFSAACSHHMQAGIRKGGRLLLLPHLPHEVLISDSHGA